MYAPDAILTLDEVSSALRLDPRTVRRVASRIGGKRMGRCWRFRWGTVMEYFSDAYIEKRPGQRLAGQSRCERQGSGQQVLPSRAQKRPGVDGGTTMGGAKEGRIPAQPGKESDPTGSELLLAWGDQYLAHAERTMSHSTYTEKKTVMQALFAYCREENITSVEELTKPMLYQFLADVADERGPKRANVYRKNVLAAWNWAIEGVEGFPQAAPALERIRPFPVEVADRYVPPEEDVIRVLQQAHGQDLVMLLTYYFTGARRSEVFRLSWERDVRLETGQIRLTDRKGKGGKSRVRWLTMHPELIRALTWWREARPCQVDNVFMQIQNDTCMGLPFRQRNHLMPKLCERAGVKPFGFHSMRHKSAAITFVGGGLNAAQILMGHSRATTTDIYVRSAGLYADRGMIPSALGEHVIGQTAARLLEMEMPHGVESHEAFCNQKSVTNRLQ